MNTFLIIYDPSLDSEILRDRIKSLGESYSFWNNHWFIQTNNTPQQVYEQISKGDLAMESILVVNMASSGMRYYGRMDVTLWEWLQNK